MYEVVKLDDSYIGDWVYYIPFGGCSADLWEKGKIKSFDNHYKRAFVIYNVGEEADWHNGNWLNFTAAGTKYEDMYLSERENG